MKHPVRVSQLRPLLEREQEIPLIRRNPYSPALLVVGPKAPPGDAHAALKGLCVPLGTLLNLFRLPVLPGGAVRELALSPLLNLDNVQIIIGVGDHVLAEGAPVGRFPVNLSPGILQTGKGHFLPQGRGQHISAKRTQHRRGAAQADALAQQLIGCLVIFLKGVVLPVVVLSREAPGQKVTGVPVPLLHSQSQRGLRRLGPGVVIAVIDVRYSLLHHVTEVFSH